MEDDVAALEAATLADAEREEREADAREEAAIGRGEALWEEQGPRRQLAWW